jgi:broad specificity phosphatase PhoE
MVQIILIRPGATQFDQQARVQGSVNIPLSDEGIEQVDRMETELRDQPIRAIYCSPCESARQTATQLGKALDAKVKPIDKLRNVNHGLWEGMLVGDVKRKHPKVYRQWQESPASVCPPEGELLGEAMTRVKAALTKVLKKHKEGTIALVTPDPLAALVRCHVRGAELSEVTVSGNNCGRWEVLDVAAPVGVNGSEV